MVGVGKAHMDNNSYMFTVKKGNNKGFLGPELDEYIRYRQVREVVAQSGLRNDVTRRQIYEDFVAEHALTDDASLSMFAHMP